MFFCFFFVWKNESQEWGVTKTNVRIELLSESKEMVEDIGKESELKENNENNNEEITLKDGISELVTNKSKSNSSKELLKDDTENKARLVAEMVYTECSI